MKRFIPLAVIAVVVFGWACTMWYFGSSPEPPEPAPNVQIVGPVNVKVGELVVYTTGSKTKFTKWTTVPNGPQLKVANDGQVLIVVFDSPGEYHIVLASGTGKGVELTKMKIRVDGEGPDPPRPPPIPPGPDPDPDVPDEWVSWVKKSVLKIEYRGLKTDVTELSGQLSSYAAQIAAGAVEDVKAARVRIRQITNSVLKENSKYWLEFSKEYTERTKEFSELPEYQIALEAMSMGLNSVLNSIVGPPAPTSPYDAAIEKSRVDKRAVLVVITSPDCPSCEELKSEWLPSSKAYGTARLVMLDRTRHKDVVETVGLRGMRGSIRVPQVHILRYVDGTWQQFGRVGYTSYSSMDRWVKSVFAWEDKP